MQLCVLSLGFCAAWRIYNIKMFSSTHRRIHSKSNYLPVPECGSSVNRFFTATADVRYDVTQSGEAYTSISSELVLSSQLQDIDDLLFMCNVIACIIYIL